MSTDAEIIESIKDEEIVWNCRFHPTYGWHEVGCPHKDWTREELLSALITKKKFEVFSVKRLIEEASKEKINA